MARLGETDGISSLLVTAIIVLGIMMGVLIEEFKWTLLLPCLVLMSGCNDECSRAGLHESGVNTRLINDVRGSVERLIEDCENFYESGGRVIIEIVQYDDLAKRTKVSCSIVSRDDLCRLSKVLVFEQQSGDVATLESQIIIYVRDSILAQYELNLYPVSAGVQNADGGWMTFLDAEEFFEFLTEIECLNRDPPGVFP